MLTYGSNKPDLRNPLRIQDVTTLLAETTCSLFVQAIQQGAVVRALRLPGGAAQPRRFFDQLGEWAKEQGAGGLGYIAFDGDIAKGPLAKFLTDTQTKTLCTITGTEAGDVIFFVAETIQRAEKIAGALRKKLGENLDLLEKNAFRFCWIVDFPMYEKETIWIDTQTHKKGEMTEKIVFSYNPFSMPQGGLEALETQDPLTIKAYQYDIVCNGIELSSGAIRNHLPAVMFKAFEIAGYTREQVEEQFGGLLRAFKYGAPPHGGCAPGVDRIVMLLADEPNLREVVAFPLNQQAQDVLMNAPAPVSPEHLKELGLQLRPVASPLSRG